MYLAGPRAETPFQIPQLNMEVHTLEGLSWQLWHHAGIIGNLLEEEGLIYWIEEDLGNKPLANRLKESLIKGRSISDRLQLILSETPYGRSIDAELFRSRMEDGGASPSQVVHYRKLGNEAYYHGDYRTALSFYRQAMAVVYDPMTDNNMGLAYMALEDSESGLKCFDRCIAKEDGPVFRLNRVKVHMLMEAYEQALEDLTHMNSLYEDVRIWYYYGKAYQALGRNEEALAAYGRAAEEGYSQGLLAFVRLAYRSEASGLVEAWLRGHTVSAWLRLRIDAEKELAMGNEERFGLLMEQAFDTAEAGSRDGIAAILLEHCIGRGQVIKGLSYLRYLVDSGAVSEEKAGYYRTVMASAAGNNDAFELEVTSMINQWKGEARRAAVR